VPDVVAEVLVPRCVVVVAPTVVADFGALLVDGRVSGGAGVAGAGVGGDVGSSTQMAQKDAKFSFSGAFGVQRLSRHWPELTFTPKPAQSSTQSDGSLESQLKNVIGTASSVTHCAH
jgi:hypothetical protein